MNSRFARNLGWIFLGNIAHAVLQFLLNIICARAFGANDYGLINYGASIIAFFMSIGTLGFYCVVTKFFAEDEEIAGEVLGTGYYARLAFSVLSIVLIQVLVSVGGKADSQFRVVILCQSFSILFASSDLFVYWYRYRNEAKTVAIIRLIAFFIAAIWKLFAILIYHSIVLYVIGVSLETGFFTAFQKIWYKKLYRQHILVFKFETLRKLLKISYPFILSSLLVTVYGQTDKVMLKNMLSNTDVGLYSVSLTLAGAISIIPSALIEGFRPDIMTSRIVDQEKYKKRFQQLYGLVFWICTCYCLFITLFSKPIILILYGNEYLGAVPSLSLIVWYTSFSYFGSINNVYMVAENKTKWVQISTLVGALLNIVLNYMLIPMLGVVGAALASLLTQVATNLIMPLMIPDLRGAFILILEGIALKGFKGMGLTQIVNTIQKPR